MYKYLNEDGEVGVLVSCGFGAGWSSRNKEDGQFLSTDKKLVEMCLRGATDNEVEEYLNSLGKTPYMGGWSDCSVEYLKEGSRFRINEHDGSETLETLEDLIYTT